MHMGTFYLIPDELPPNGKIENEAKKIFKLVYFPKYV